MGNEFGHPEWIDFPREGNNHSYHYARRLWSLRDNPELLYWCLAEFDESMLRLINTTGALEQTRARRLYTSDADKIIAFERGDLVFIFNFHSTHSVTDYSIMVPPGKPYIVALDTDEEHFGGQNRISQDQVFNLIPDMRGNEMVTTIKIYLPCRTAMVLKRVEG
jgi:1,4-alpha-glucan branching enzyme